MLSEELPASTDKLTAKKGLATMPPYHAMLPRVTLGLGHFGQELGPLLSSASSTRSLNLCSHTLLGCLLRLHDVTATSTNFAWYSREDRRIPNKT